MKRRIYQKKTGYKWRHLSLCLLFLWAVNSYARPDMTPLGANIADKGSAFYHFSIREFRSADGKRHYKVWTGVPDKAPPASGFPVLYMLDGNAVMDRLSDTFLKQLSAQTPPVLIVIGYQTALPFDSEARTYDYTPADKEHHDTDRYGRKGGGSEIFRHLLEETIAPLAESNLKINSRQRGIWGHSYAGLFVLDSYLSSAFFNLYYTASPSLKRNNFALVRKIQMINKDDLANKQLYVMEGDGDLKKRDVIGGIINSPDEQNQAIGMVSSLRADGIAATYQLYPGLTHGQMFTPSFQAALLDIAKNH